MADHLQGGGVVLLRPAHQLAGAQIVDPRAGHLHAVAIVAQRDKGLPCLVEFAQAREPLGTLIDVFALQLPGHRDQQPDHQNQDRHDDGGSQQQPAQDLAVGGL